MLERVVEIRAVEGRGMQQPPVQVLRMRTLRFCRSSWQTNDMAPPLLMRPEAYTCVGS